MRLGDARGFMFDLDGTLVRRTHDGHVAIDGAPQVLDAIRESGRPLVVFTNASHVAPARIAASARKGGLQLAENEVLTPVCSAISYLRRNHPGARVLVIGTDDTRERMAADGIDLAVDAGAASAEVVFVAHVDEFDADVFEGAAHAILAGAPFLTSNYLRAYAGIDGPILSRGAMAAAAIAKASAKRPRVVGKPSKPAVNEIGNRLGVAPGDVTYVGDDVKMDIGLGHLAGGRTVLVKTGISGGESNGVPENRRPHLVLEDVGELLTLL